MFKEARIKLTLYYLVIMMIINVFFSLIIYRGATSELRRIESIQHLRRPAPFKVVIEPEIVEETKRRIAFALVYLNIFILGIAGAGSYLLAGKNFEAIKKKMDVQKKFFFNAFHGIKN